MISVARLRTALAGEFVRNVATLASGTAFAQLVGAAATLAIYRLYSKADIDMLTVYSSVFFTFNTPMALRFDQAVPLCKSKIEAAHMVWLCNIMSLIVVILTLVGTWVFRSQIAAVTHVSLFSTQPWIVPLMLLGAALFQNFGAWCTYSRQFTSQARATAVQSVATVALQLLPVLLLPIFPILLFGGKAFILVLGFAVGRSVGFLQLFHDFRRETDHAFPGVVEGKALFKRFKEFATVSTPACLANAAGLQAPAALLVALYPVGSGAAFYAGARLLGAPMALLGAAVAQAYAGQAAKTLKGDPQNLLKLFDGTTRRLFKISLLMLPVGFSAPLWMPFLLHTHGPEANWTMWLTPSFCLSLVCSPISVTSSIVEKLRVQFAADVGRFALTVAAFVVPHMLGQSNDEAVRVYAVMMTVTYAGYILLYRSMAAKASRQSMVLETPELDVRLAIDTAPDEPLATASILRKVAVASPHTETVDLVRSSPGSSTAPQLPQQHAPESAKKRIVKKVFRIFVAAPLRFVAPALGFDRKYLTGRHFDDHISGWRMLIRAILFQKMFGWNRSCRFPISHQSACQNGKNLVFHPDDFNNLWHFGCYFQNFDGKIIIGKGTYIAPNVGIITANHDPEDLDRHLPGSTVEFGEGCWIGMNAMIMPGVVLGPRTIVGAGAVVTKSFPEGHVVLGGVPAKVLRVNSPPEPKDGR